MNQDTTGEAKTPQTSPGQTSGLARSGVGVVTSLQPGQREAGDGGGRPAGSAGLSSLVRKGPEAISSGSEQVDALFASKCKELKGFVKPLTAILNGLKNGRYGKGLSNLQQNVAIDRIQRIVGVLENPGMGGKYLATLQQVEMMLKSWFPKIKPQFSTSAERLQNGRPSSDSGSPSHYRLSGDATNPNLNLTITNHSQTLPSDVALSFGTAEDLQQDSGQESIVAPKGMPPTSLTWTHVSPIVCPALDEKASHPVASGGMAHSAMGSRALPDSGVQHQRCCSLQASLGSTESSPSTSREISPSHASASPGTADVFIPLNHQPIAGCTHPEHKGTRSLSSKARNLASPINLCAERGLATADADAVAGQEAAESRFSLLLSQRRKLESSQTCRLPAPSDRPGLESCSRTAAEEEVGPSSLVANECAGGRHGSVNRKRGFAEKAPPGESAVPQHKIARQ